MNELGLTRESIRELVVQVVKETVERKFQSMDHDGSWKELIDRTFRDKYNGSNWGEVDIVIKTAAKNEAEKFFREHLKITLNENLSTIPNS